MVIYIKEYEVIFMRNTLIMRYPAGWHGDMWREAIPVGNGEIGGLVYGGVHKEIISIIHGKLWEGSIDKELPDVIYILPEIRKYLSENKPIEAEYLMRDELKKLGYKVSVAKPLPLCDLIITQKNRTGFTNYRRQLNMQTAEASVTWTEGEAKLKRNFFISRKTDTACLDMTAENSVIEAEFTIDIHDRENLPELVDITDTETTAEGNMIFFAAKCEGKDFGAVLKLVHDGTSVCNGGKITVTNASKISAFMRVFIYGDRNNDLKSLSYELTETNYPEELSRHTELHSPIYNAQTLSLGGKNYSLSNEELMLSAYDDKSPIELIEKMWSFGRYLLICSARQNGYPCHLYGVWAGAYRLMWAFNMYNVNLEMIYWQALSGGMPELLMSVFDYAESKMDDYRENAKKLYGCRGINIPSVSTPESGLHKVISPHILHWTAAAGWLSQFYFDYYLYTGDKEFLKNRAMPFMNEAAEFFEDFLFEGNDGKYVFSPSNSPENSPKNIAHGLDQHEVALNATMDIAILKELLSNLIKGAEITDTYKEKTDLWNKMLSKLPLYQVNSDGAIKEWTHPFYEDNYEHRHQSHVYPVFPGYEITRADNSNLYPAFEKAIELRESVGLKDQSGWSLMYMANVYARMGKGDKALNCMDYVGRSVLLSNFLTVHNDWRRMGVAMCNDIRRAPVQIDTNMGYTSAILEMLVFSTPKQIFLFNALPSRFKEGNAGPLCTRTLSSVNLSWNEKTAEVSILHKGEPKDITLILPCDMSFDANGENSMKITLEKGKTITLSITRHSEELHE